MRLKAKGYQIVKILENSVSKYPALEGRFPIVSNIKFSFDPAKSSLQRIDPQNVLIGDQTIILDKEYTLSTREYIYMGYDGYDEFPNCINIDSTDLDAMFEICLKYFEIIRDLQPEYLKGDIYSLNFGFDKQHKKILDLIKKTIVFKDDRPFLDIDLLFEDRICELK